MPHVGGENAAGLLGTGVGGLPGKLSGQAGAHAWFPIVGEDCTQIRRDPFVVGPGLSSSRLASSCDASNDASWPRCSGHRTLEYPGDERRGGASVPRRPPSLILARQLARGAFVAACKRP